MMDTPVGKLQILSDTVFNIFLTYVFSIYVKFNILSSTQYFNNIFVTVWNPKMH